MSMHSKPLTPLEHEGLAAHGLDIGAPSQLSDAFRQGLAWAMAQHQGEPVAWLYTGTIDGDHLRKSRMDHFFVPVGGDGSEYVKGVPLYTHADPAEVERLRDIERGLRNTVDIANRTTKSVMRKLAERDALLRRALSGGDDSLGLDIDAALSASAEPSAPVYATKLEHPVYRGDGGILKDLTHRGPPARSMPVTLNIKCAAAEVISEFARQELVPATTPEERCLQIFSAIVDRLPASFSTLENQPEFAISDAKGRVLWSGSGIDYAQIATAIGRGLASEDMSSATPQKYDDTLAPFVKLMRAELTANSHKGDREGWLRRNRRDALLELHYHVSKLHYAAGHGERERTIEFAADTANCCMMLLDVMGLLEVEQGAAPATRPELCYHEDGKAEIQVAPGCVMCAGTGIVKEGSPGGKPGGKCDGIPF